MNIHVELTVAGSNPAAATKNRERQCRRRSKLNKSFRISVCIYSPNDTGSLFSPYLLTKKCTIMKEFWSIMEKDYQKENFTTQEMVVYGIIAPLTLVAVMALAGWMESLI